MENTPVSDLFVELDTWLDIDQPGAPAATPDAGLATAEPDGAPAEPPVAGGLAEQLLDAMGMPAWGAVASRLPSRCGCWAATAASGRWS